MPLNSTRGAASAKAFGFTSGSAPIDVDYVVVAGGASGATGQAGGWGGGAGAGGYRTSFPGGTKITLAKGSTPIQVGGGGPSPGPVGSNTRGVNGVDSVFDIITSAGGGGGGVNANPAPSGSGLDGGSGGGGGENTPGGTGNTPPVSPPQGNPGGTPVGAPGAGNAGSGGGGATQTGIPGGNASGGAQYGGTGGNGASNSITGSPVSYAGGGGGAGNAGGAGAAGGTGGGGTGAFGGPLCSPGSGIPATAGTVNTGGGGGGGIIYSFPGGSTCRPGQAGGSGTVIIRAPGAAGPRISVSPGSNTKTTSPGPDGAATVLTFTVTGSLTVS